MSTRTRIYSASLRRNEEKHFAPFEPPSEGFFILLILFSFFLEFQSVTKKIERAVSLEIRAFSIALLVTRYLDLVSVS